LTGVVLPLISRWISKQPAIALVKTRAELNALLVDEVQGIADLLSFDQASQHQGRMLALNHELCRAQERMAMMRGVSNGLAALFTSLAGLTVLGLAIPLVSNGTIEGVYLALLPLTAIASFEAVQPLSLALQQLAANQAAARRLFELIDAAPAVMDPDRASPSKLPASRQPDNYGIEVRDLRFRYAPGEPLVLDGLSFSVPPGRHAAIVGPSGSGKSTIVNLLLRFWEIQEGQIRVSESELRESRADDTRALFGVVPQQVHLFNATLRDNLLLADPDATDDQIISACRQAQLDDLIRSLPLGYDTLIGENGLLLSGGERQRLAIARAILKNAPMLILDEATANLDAVSEQQIVRTLEPFMHNRTTLIISHSPPRWGHVDQVITIENGRVIGVKASESAPMPE
jgi:ABC-type multidrug transport system fused ATPase/permease subunit